MFVSPEKMAEPQFGVRISCAQGLDGWAQDSPREGAIFEGCLAH